MMGFTGLLIANRGEIGVRIARAAAELGLRSVAAYSDDDAHSLHTRVADEARPLGAKGVAAYLDAERIVSSLEAGLVARQDVEANLAPDAVLEEFLLAVTR